MLRDAGVSRSIDDVYAACQTPAIKEALKSNTTAAADAGACGVPTFCVHDETLFGQDRLAVVCDLINGWSADRANSVPSSKL